MSNSSSERGKAQMSHKTRRLAFDRVKPKHTGSSRCKAYVAVPFSPSTHHVCKCSSRLTQTETALIEPASLHPSCL